VARKHSTGSGISWNGKGQKLLISILFTTVVRITDTVLVETLNHAQSIN